MSWKQYGGIKNLDSYNNVSVNNIIADKITVRDKFLTEFQIIGETQLLGDVILGDTSLNTISLKSDVIADRNIDVSGDVQIRNGKLIFSSSGEGFFLKGTDNNKLGINVENPLAVLDISGSYESVLNLYSDQSNNRNIIARNYLQHGIAVNVTDDDSASLEFYSGTDISNDPDSEIKYNNGGILEIITGQDTRILSQVSISADGSKGHIHDETMVVYDMSNGTYKDLYYKDDTIFKGNALSLIARDSSANTSMNITTPDGKGAVISGGAYPINNAKSMLVLDVSNNSEKKPQALMIVSGQKTEKYNTTTSINKYISQTEHYSLDVNGATYIADSQINIQEERNMHFLKVATHEGHVLAAGSYDTDDGKLVVYESTDDGVSWEPIPDANIDGDNFSDVQNQSVKDIFMNNRVRCIIITGTSNALWVSVNEYPDTPNSDFVIYDSFNININFVSVNPSFNSIYSFHDGTHNHFITARDTKLDIFKDNTNNTNNPYDVEFTINDVKGINNRIYAVGAGGNIKSYTVDVNVYNTTNIFVERSTTIENANSSKTYKRVFVYDANTVIAVGDGIITYTHDGGSNWYSETTVVSGRSLNDVHIKSESEAIVVGDNGKIFVSHDAYRTWKQLDNNYINGGGTGKYLTGETDNDITSITMTSDNNNIITTHKLTTTPNNTGRLLLTYAPSVLNRDNSSTLDVIGSLSVSGDLVLHDRGELKTTDVSFGLLKTNTKQIDFGLSGELINIGEPSGLVYMNGRLQVADDVSFNSDIYVTENAVIYSNLDVCGNTIIKGTLTVDGSLNFRGDISQTDICHNVLISDQLKVRNIQHNEVALVVQQDIAAASIAEFKKEGSTKVEITNDGDIHMNSVLKIMDERPSHSGVNTDAALYVKGGTRLDGSLNVMGSAYFNSPPVFRGGDDVDPITFPAGMMPVLDISGDGVARENRSFTYTGSLLTDKFSNFNVYGGANFHGSIVVDNILYGHQMDISGDASFNADLFASGDISANTNLYLGGDASLNADLFVSGDISANTKFYLGGDASLNADLFVSGDISANTNLYLGGDASLNSKLYVSGDISANSNLYLGGDASLNSKLFIGGDISANTNLYLGGDASLNSDLFVSGETKLGTVNNSGVPLYVDGSGAMRIPVGSTIDRYSLEKETGLIRFNTTDDTFEGYDGSNWGSLGGVSNPDKSSQVYINDVSAIVFETNSIIRETIDNSGNVLFDLSNNQGYGKIKMRQDLSATVLQVSDSSNNNHISIQNQGAFKLIYDQSSAITNSQMEMKVNDMSYNEIILYPSYPEPALTSNSNGVMIGSDSVLYSQLNDMSWNQIGYKGIDGTKLGNTVSISRNGKRVAFGEYDASGSPSSKVHIYNVFEREIIHLETINIYAGNVSSIDLNEDGTCIIIGKYNTDVGPNNEEGQIEYYREDSNGYAQKALFNGGTEYSYLGHTTSINNDGTIFAAGRYNNNSNGQTGVEGGVLIYEYENGLIADISMNNGGGVDQYQQMGRSIELNGAGDRIVIGGTIDKSGDETYQVYIYELSGTNWVNNLTITNPGAGINFGISVAMSNDGKVISVATQEDLDLTENGKVYVYDLSGSGVEMEAILRGSVISLDPIVDPINDGDTFGSSMSLNDDGSVLAIGCGSHNSFNGKAFIYKYTNGDWIEIKTFDGGTGSNLGGIHDYNDESSWLVSDEDGICLDGTGELVIIGAPNLFTADNADGSGNGQVYLHRNQTYTLGVNKKLRVKGDIVIDDGYLDISGYAKIAGDIDIGGNLVLTGTPGATDNSLSNQIIFRELYINDDPDDENFFIGTDITGASTDQQSMEFGFYDSSGAEATKNDSLMTLMANGNVGIGNTNPQSKLEVLGAEFNENGLKLSKTDGENGSDVGTLQIYQNGDDKGDGITIMGQTNSISHSLWKDVSGTFHISRNNISAQYQFVQTLDGNVGIGTTDPNYKLHVNGDSFVDGNIWTSGLLRIDGNNSIDGYDNVLRINDGQEWSSGTRIDGNLDVSGDLTINNSNLRLQHTTNDISYNPYILLDSCKTGEVHGGISSLYLTERFNDETNFNGAYIQYDGNDNDLYIGTRYYGDSHNPAITINRPSDMSGPSTITMNRDTIFDGNVGIGTTEPSSILHISNGTSGDCVLTLEADTDDGGGEGDTCYINFKQDGGRIWNSIYTTSNALNISNTVNSSGGISFRTNKGDTPVGGHPEDSGIERMKIESEGNITMANDLSVGGNVGIGTTDPQQKLDVRGNIVITNGGKLYFNNIADISSDSSKANFYINHNQGQWLKIGATIQDVGKNWIFIAPTSGKLYLGTDTNSMIILGHGYTDTTKIGNVGIGTGDPSAKLEVNGTVKATLFEGGKDTDQASYFGRAAIGYDGNTTDYASFSHYDKNTSSGFAIRQGPDGNTTVNSVSGQNLNLSIANTAKMTVNANGNLGIGTADPQQKLEVHGNINLGANGASSFIHSGEHVALSADATVLIVSDSNQVDPSATTMSDIIFGSGSDVDTHSSRDFTFGGAYPDVVPLVEHMRIDGGSGNVGIGTTNPSAKLEVNGTVNVTGTVTTGNVLQVGTNTGDETPKTIYFGGTYNDNDYDFCVIENRVYESDTQKRELLLFSGDNQEGSFGPDRIRLKGANICFDTYNAQVTNRTTTNTKMIIDDEGNVGIGTTSPDEKLDVNGNVKATLFNATSDIRVKTNIETIEPKTALEQINKLEPKTYKFYDNEETHYGLIAQDTEQIIPEAVNTNGTKMIPSIGETCKLINDGKTIVLDTKTTTDMVVTKLEFDDLNGNKQSVRIESFEGDKCIHLKESIEKRVKDEQSVFVHGHEVNDFRSINYNTIVATSIAATKALTTELNETRTELNELKKLVEQLMNK